MLRVYRSSDKGLVRKRNEDNHFVGQWLFRDEKVYLWIVADGMGGHQAGDVASAMAINILVNHFEAVLRGQQGVPDFERAMTEGIQQANADVFAMASRREDLAGMGTTLTAAFYYGANLVTGHIGDSRAYLLDGKDPRQITADHSLVAEMVKSGDLTAEEAEDHPHRNIITRALGTEDSVVVEVSTHQVSSGDWLLLCSDGLTDMVSKEEIAQIIHSQPSERDPANRLVSLAKERGGHDNVTVILVQI